MKLLSLSPFSTGSGSVFPFNSRIMDVLREAADAGGAGAGGGTGDQGTSYDQSQGGQRGGSDRGGRSSQQQRGSGSGSGTATAYRLTDDSIVDLDGSGKGVKWSEARAAYVPKADHDKLRGTFDQSRDFLMSEATRLDKLQTQLNERERAMRSGSQQQQQSAKQDIAEELAGMGLIDGNAAARIVKELRAQGLAPLAQAFASQQKMMAGMRTEIDQLKQGLGPAAADQQSRQFDGHITGLMAKIPDIKGLSQPLSAYAAKHPVIKEILTDLWSSYDPKTWTEADFTKMAAARIEGLINLLREDQKHAVESAQQKKRQFFNSRNGNAHPSGQGGYQHMRGMDIARESGLFDTGNRQ